MFVAGKRLQSPAPSAHTKWSENELGKVADVIIAAVLCLSAWHKASDYGPRFLRALAGTHIFTSLWWCSVVLDSFCIHDDRLAGHISPVTLGIPSECSDNDIAHSCRNGRGEAGKNTRTTKTDATTITTKIATATTMQRVFVVRKHAKAGS